MINFKNSKRASWLGAALFSSIMASTLGVRVALADPAGWQRTGEFTTQGAWQVAGEKASVNGVLAPQSVVEFGLRLQLKQKAVVSIQGTDAKPLVLTLEAQDKELNTRNGKIPLPDALVNVLLKAPDGSTLFKNDYYLRPNPVFYKGDEFTALVARWSTLPPASQHDLRLKVIADTNGAGIWLDDRFLGRSPITFPATIKVDLANGNALGSVQARAVAVDRSRFVPIGLQGYRTGSTESVSLPFPRAALQVQDGVPYQVAAAGDAVDVGVSRWLEEQFTARGYVDQQYTRSPFDSLSDNILMAVPTDDYVAAHLLATVDPDPNKTPVVTLTLTRNLHDSGDSGGRGDGIAYSSIRLEKKDGAWPKGVREIGVVTVKDRAGRNVKMPLLDVTIPINSGEIPDVIDETGMLWERSTQNLDLELTKEIHPVSASNHNVFSTKPIGKPSAATVYGLTLERAPVKVRVLSRQTGNIFYKTEKPGFDLTLQNRTPQAFNGILRWKLTDYYGRTTDGERKANLPAQTEPTTIGIDLPGIKLGWYQAELTLVNAQNDIIWKQPTSLAVLAPDTRKAGLESPYGAWWFRAGHGGTKDLDTVAPLYQRMGFRHINPWSNPSDPSGAELAKYNMSMSMIRYIRGADLEKSLETLDKWIELHPQTKQAMVFHESGFGAGWQFPPEFLGQPKPELDELQRASYDKTVTQGIEYARRIRAKYPEMKLIVGNGGLPFISGLMQNGYPKELVDEWGDEEVGQANIPEAPPNAGQSDFYWIQEYDKLYGYNKPVTSAYEWRGRGTNPGNLTELEQAQYYTRDVLKALAFGASSINPGLIFDVGDSYYYSRWGSGGFLHRYPLFNPKMSYVAMSVLTQQLDQAKLQRVLDTDSPTLHAMEFKQGNDFVYALWTPRGEKPASLTFGTNSTLQLTDMNGQTSPVALKNNQAAITVSDSPVYLRSSGPITKISSGDTVLAQPRSTLAVVDAMNSLDQWKADPTPDAELEKAHFDFPRRVGNIDVQAVPDDVKKAALELTLKPDPKMPWPIARHITLRPKTPIALPGNPAAVGVWVKGNSSWGKVFFEIEDAKGEKFYSMGAIDFNKEENRLNSWSLGDWKGTRDINFDGWNYISAKLPAQYPGGFPQSQQSDWRSNGGDGVVNYPVKVSKLVVSMRDKVVQLNRAVDVPNRSIRLSGLSSE